MTDKRKSRPLVAQETGQAETAAGKTHDSYINHTTALAGRQPGFIADLLLRGQENAIPLRQLKAMTGRRGRDLRKQIERGRRRGIPILSDNLSGYFLPANEDERERCIKSLRHRASEIFRTAAAIEGTAGLARKGPQQLDGQGCIWDGGDSDG